MKNNGWKLKTLPGENWTTWSWKGGPLNGDFGVCSCVRGEWSKIYYSFPNCLNCLGYGIMPIPWSELNK